MDILISWSKAQSKTVVFSLHQWLPDEVLGIKPWMSSKDIAKGREWFRELQDERKRVKSAFGLTDIFSLTIVL